MRNGGFSDRIEFLGTRAYDLGCKIPADKPVEISVVMKAHPDQLAPPLYSAAAIPNSGEPGKKNIARNGGFEEASLPGWPLYFHTGYSVPRMGRPNAGNGQCTTDPYEGKYCLRIVKNRDKHNWVIQYCDPKPDKPTSYVLSFYAKGSKPDSVIRIYGGSWTAQNITITTEWKRYHTVCTIPAGGVRYNAFMLMIPPPLPWRDTIWVDAVQVEKGTEPTEFEN